MRRYRFRRGVRTVAAVAAGGILALIFIKMLMPLVATLAVAALIVWLIVYALKS
ncbi:MAG TPA: hypothetical protein VNI20_13945 [Fimbriimonadaceae bacterium]|nr:hypothetical protein [Fimbriimonadaceae bacterium]